MVNTDEVEAPSRERGEDRRSFKSRTQYEERHGVK